MNETLVGRHGWFMSGYWEHTAVKMMGMRLTVSNQRLIFRTLWVLDKFEISLSDIRFAETPRWTMFSPFPTVRLYYAGEGAEHVFTFSTFSRSAAKKILQGAGITFR